MRTKKEELFNKCLKKWVSKTWAGWWKVDVVYKTAHEFNKIDSGRYAGAVAVCETRWEYMEALITVNSDALEEQDEEDIEYLALHELMHVFLNEMREEGIEHEERVATFLARSFLTAVKK